VISVDFTPLFLYYVIVFDIVSVLSVLDEKMKDVLKVDGYLTVKM